MPNLYDLTDASQPQDASLPVEQPYSGANLGPLQPVTAAPVGNTPVVVSGPQPDVVQALDTRPEPMAQYDPNASVGTLSTIINKLTGANDTERYQLWPEKVVREALAAPHDAMEQGVLPAGLRREDYTDIPAPSMPTNDSTWLGQKLGIAPVATSPADQLIAGAQATAALAGTGGLAGIEEGAGTALGSTPFLRPALKYGDRIYKAPVNGQHLDALPAHLAQDFQTKAMSGDDISHYNFGFMNHKGQFLDREKALDYAVKEGLVDPSAGQYGALTSTLLADSSKPGMAIEAMAKTGEPFYSALEHNVNQISQAKMTGDQWLGTLANKPGVKPEEMDWTGVKDFLKERGSQPVTKAELQEHLANNKVELKEVNKGANLEAPEIAAKRQEFQDLNDKAEEVERKGGELTQPEYDRMHQLSGELMQHPNPHLDKNNATKYHSYQLPGGENYREMLMTLPVNREAHARAMAGKAWDVMTPEQRTEFMSKPIKGGSDTNVYKSSHWDEPNILAHVRMNDRTIDGKKSLHLEEIQSDWHQQGREKGYKDTPAINSLMNELQAVEKNFKPLKELPEGFELIKDRDQWGVTPPGQTHARPYSGLHQSKEAAMADALTKINERELIKAKDVVRAKINEAENGVPDAPFKKTWHELALKRMIREAAEKGYDRLSWTPGEAQAARYDLSKSIGSLKATPIMDQHGLKYEIRATSPSGTQEVLNQVHSADELPNVVGKEMTKKIIDETEGKHPKTFKGLDLKVGGEGMKGFYDQIIPKALSKISGEKVKTANISPTFKIKEVPIKDEVRPRSVYDVENSKGDLVSSFHTRADAQERIDALVKEKSNLVHYIDIPQSLKDKAMQKGFPLFSGNYMYTPVSGNPFDKKKKSK